MKIIGHKSLGDQLHDLVEESQGRAHISDGTGKQTDKKILQIAKIALDWNLETVRRLRAFIKEHRMKTNEQTLS